MLYLIRVIYISSHFYQPEVDIRPLAVFATVEFDLFSKKDIIKEEVQITSSFKKGVFFI